MSENLQSSVFLPSAADLAEGANIQDIFNCFICLGKVQNPQLCPCCSKLCCNTCIQKWLTEQRAQCPHCRAPLRVQNLVNCRFVSDISAALEKLQAEKNENSDKWPIHSHKLSYYCKTCETCICADWAVLETTHTGHEFKPLQAVYDEQVEKIRSEAKGLRERLKDLTILMHLVDGNIDKLKSSKEEKENEYMACLEQMQNRLEFLLHHRMLVLNSRKQVISDEVEILEQVHVTINKELSQNAKSTFITKTPELIKMLQDVQERPTANISDQMVSTDFESEIIPEYDSTEFYLRDYSSLRDASETVFSDSMNTNGLIWRLKIYPNGNGVAKGSFISVFLEMVKGLQDSSKYQCRVEMVNQRDSQVCVAREFESDFETGESWGYNRFFKNELLEEEGYLIPEDDQLLFKFYIRPPTYFQKCRDQKKYIEQLEAKSNQSSTVSELKDKNVPRIREFPKKKHIYTSDENPLERISADIEETKQAPNMNFTDENCEPMFWDESANPPPPPDSINRIKPEDTYNRLMEIRKWEKRRIREEGVSREEHANAVAELSTVFQKYMMSPEIVSSSESQESKRNWSDEIDMPDFNADAELLSNMHSDSDPSPQHMNDEFAIEELGEAGEELRNNLLEAFEHVQKMCLEPHSD